MRELEGRHRRASPFNGLKRSSRLQAAQNPNPQLKVHTKTIRALLQADSRWYFLPAVELPVILTPGEDGYIVAEGRGGRIFRFSLLLGSLDGGSI